MSPLPASYSQYTLFTSAQVRQHCKPTNNRFLLFPGEFSTQLRCDERVAGTVSGAEHICYIKAKINFSPRRAIHNIWRRYSSVNQITSRVHCPFMKIIFFSICPFQIRALKSIQRINSIYSLVGLRVRLKIQGNATFKLSFPDCLFCCCWRCLSFQCSLMPILLSLFKL